ncbi:hypothetical protein ACVQ8P_03600 [Dellaglioa sp. BT-FLS60]
MQNKQQTTIQTIGSTLQYSYHKIFDLDDFILKPQMPQFQLKLFTEQSLKSKKTIILQLNPTGFQKEFQELRGTLHRHSTSKQLLFKTQYTNVTYLLNNNQLRYIALLDSI